MAKGKIFLSYRRHDIPGYVRMLEQQLEEVFGAGRVFRDTSDIPGGAQWRETIEQNLRDSAALLLIIGPHWERIWRERQAGEENYVAYELQLARKYSVKVIPVSVDGVQISKDCDLGELDWIRGPQTYDLSDRQNRWSNDFSGLVELLEQIDGIGAASGGRERKRRSASGRSRFKWAVPAAAAAIALVLWAASEHDPSAEADNSFDNRTPYAEDNDPATAGVPPAEMTETVPRAPEEPVYRPPAGRPDLSGTWQGLDGTLYFVFQRSDGTIEVQSPDYTHGYGAPVAGAPGTYNVEMAGVGAGQFSVSADGYTITGWLDTAEGRINDRLVRIE